MSETTKTAEVTKRATDPAARSSQAHADTPAKAMKEANRDTTQAQIETSGWATRELIGETSQTPIDMVGRATKEAIGQTSHLAATGIDRAAEAAQRVTETIAESTEQSRGAMTAGVQAAADAGSKAADITLGQSDHLLASVAHAMDVYRDASERSAERVQALLSSYMTFGRGLQEMQHVWLEMVDHTLESAAHRPQDLLRCKTIVEVAEVQRDHYAAVINQALASTGRLLDIAGRTAQEAVRPLRPHAH